MTSTRAPAARANWTANVEVPAPAPRISTVWPEVRPPRVKSARHAVRPASGRAAASCQSSRAGLAKTLAAGTRTCWANVPSSGPPRILKPGPSTRGSSPHSIPGLMTTSSPSEIPPTPEPSARTTPAPSEPGTSGADTPGQPPATTRRSRRLSAAARRSTTTSPGCRDELRHIRHDERFRPTELAHYQCLRHSNPPARRRAKPRPSRTGSPPVRRRGRAARRRWRPLACRARRTRSARGPGRSGGRAPRGARAGDR